ncbi:CxC2 domain-containing protein [Mycena venus]|uniref:CxC2 domain-containing protein n=1 Tax=Mycena venus TaxID=2733690 RepID=A0A8H7CGH1_9AGAR|nr:CxC2 domain-containing protein [Mycena venus]
MSSDSTSHKQKAKKPALVVAATASSVSHTTHDQRRVRTKLGVVGQDAGPSISGPVDQFWADDLATNRVRNSVEFSYQLGDDCLESQPDPGLEDGITVVVQSVGRNTNADRPLINWHPHKDEYLRENLQREGRGAPKTYVRCAGSRFLNPRRECPLSDKCCMDPRHKCPNRECEGPAEWRCVDQGCLGEIMHCVWCIVAAHAQHPTHLVEASSQKWNGMNFARDRKWLQKLGLRVQLGHPPGVVCTSRQAAPQDFVLYDVTGVHEISVDLCGCPQDLLDRASPAVDRRIQCLRACWWPATVSEPRTCATFRVLQLFQILNCLGKLSAYDFLRGLEKITNHDGLDKPPDRRKPFMFIVRQWREIKRHKRAKRGHCEGGIAATKQGELAIQCRACPQVGWNLPEGWENIDPFYRYIYFLFLAQDANFRLSNRTVSSEAADPIMGDGFGYFAKRHGEDGYNAHVVRHANEEELSNCSGFQAMFLANTKRVKGLRTTGIGGVTCSRHNMWRVNGIGDLQVGERQCNMDFILLATLIGFPLLCLVVSYDIACQYAWNFFDRMYKMPPALQLSLAPRDMWWMVPNFHLPAHKPKCHSPYSFHWMWGAGMTHGEGVEQKLGLLEQGGGATLEDVFGFHNYDRLLAMHRVLPKRLAMTIKESTQHKVAFEAFTKGLEAVWPKEVEEWKGWVKRWEGVQHDTPDDSPFELKNEVSTLRKVQERIAQEEFICTDDGVEIEREHTPGGFITMGLEIEEVQRRLAVDVRALQDPSPSQKLAFLKRRTTLLKRIHRFRQLQRVYMPSVRAVLSDQQKQIFDGNGEQVPEATRLFMPSDIEDAKMRGRACTIGLAAVEERMREGEAEEALEGVWRGLQTRTMTNRYKLRNYTGQGMMTKGQGILRQINIRIHIAKVRYRYARAALLGLQGHGDWEDRLRLLGDDDVRALNERALTAEEKAQNEHWAELGGAIIEGGIARAAGVASGEGSHTLLWIWYEVGAGENDKRLEEALRVEWCKAFARTTRYEEVRLLREEMRRTIAYRETAAKEWDCLAADELPGASPELTEGRRAYAAEHAATERSRCADLRKRWRGILVKADAFLGGGDAAAVAAAGAEAVTVEVDPTDELDPEEEEALLEGEEDDLSVPALA